MGELDAIFCANRKLFDQHQEHTAKFMPPLQQVLKTVK
jgi:hypothetical protein